MAQLWDQIIIWYLLRLSKWSHLCKPLTYKKVLEMAAFFICTKMRDMFGFLSYLHYFITPLFMSFIFSLPNMWFSWFSNCEKVGFWGCAVKISGHLLDGDERDGIESDDFMDALLDLCFFSCELKLYFNEWKLIHFSK